MKLHHEGWDTQGDFTGTSEVSDNYLELTSKERRLVPKVINKKYVQDETSS